MSSVATTEKVCYWCKSSFIPRKVEDSPHCPTYTCETGR